MKRPRIVRRRLGRWLLLMFLSPPAFWGLVLAAVPTEWARSQVETALAEAAGQPCQLEGLSLGPLGDVRLRGVELAEPGRELDPWLRAESVRIDVRLIQLLHGRLQPTSIRAEGVALRVRRDHGGNFEFQHLLRTDPDTPGSTGSSADPSPTGDPEVRYRLVDSRVTILDEPTGTRLEFTGLKGHGTWQRCRAKLTALTGHLNGGTFALEAELDRGVTAPMFEGQLNARNVAVGEGMNVLGYVAPVLAGASAGVDGRMDLNLYLRGTGDTADTLARSLVGQGAIRLDPIHLERSHLLAELGHILTLPEGARLGALRSDFGIANRRVMSKNLIMEVAGVPIALAGWTDFDGRVDYRIRSDVLADRVSPELRQVFTDMPLGLDDLLELRVQGTPTELVVTLDGMPVHGGSAPLTGRDHLRDLGRRLRDRVLR